MTTRERFRLKRATRKVIADEQKSIKAFSNGNLTSPYTTENIERIVLKSVEEFNAWMK